MKSKERTEFDDLLEFVGKVSFYNVGLNILTDTHNVGDSMFF